MALSCSHRSRHHAICHANFGVLKDGERRIRDARYRRHNGRQKNVSPLELRHLSICAHSDSSPRTSTLESRVNFIMKARTKDDTRGRRMFLFPGRQKGNQKMKATNAASGHLKRSTKEINRRRISFANCRHDQNSKAGT